MSQARPVLRWHGGKWMLAPWIIDHFPLHQIYVEPFGGAASVLMRKKRVYAEVYNDLDKDVVNLFRVLREPSAAQELICLLRLTPFSRVEFNEAYDLDTACPIERARALVVRSFMGFGSNGHSQITGFRANSNRSGSTPARDWANYPDCLDAIIERLSGVIVEHRKALDVMRQHDGAKTLHYVDPPYVFDTRGCPGKGYAHEMSDDDHVELLDVLNSLQGMVVLSGYPHEIYEQHLSGWKRVERVAFADGARKRTEVLWINHVATELLMHENREPKQEVMPI